MLLKPKKPLMLLLVMILTLCVTGCELTPKNDYCLIATMPIYTDKDVDVISDELARWLDRHQAQYKAVCIDR